VATINIQHVKVKFSLLKNQVINMISGLTEIRHDLELESLRGLNI
jgi:hypothetical protein